MTRWNAETSPRFKARLAGVCEALEGLTATIGRLTGLEGCQCRTARIIRNHIACAILVWARLKQVANETKQTVYRLKHGLLSDYLRQQLKSPAIQMSFEQVLL